LSALLGWTMADTFTEQLIALEKSAMAMAEATRVGVDAVRETATACLAQRAPNTADFYYDKDNWEYTWEESDFFDMLTAGDYDKRVLRVGRLQKLPDQWAARVPLGEPYEEGDYEEYEWTLFDTEAEARAAAKEVPNA